MSTYNKYYKALKRHVISDDSSADDSSAGDSSTDSNIVASLNDSISNFTSIDSGIKTNNDSSSEIYSDFDSNDDSIITSSYSNYSDSLDSVTEDIDIKCNVAALATEPSFKSKLIKIIKKHRPTNAFCNDLLHLLHDDHSELPLSIITLLGKKEPVNISVMSGVEYSYLDFRKKLTQHLSTYSYHTLLQIEKINLTMNVDGLPLYKSSNQSVWPILFCIRIPPYKVFSSAITMSFKSNYSNYYKCKSKPESDLNFLNDTINDLKDVLLNGIDIHGRNVIVKLSAIICDAPAKSFIKQTKQFNGIHGCDKCVDPGTIIKLPGETKGRRCYLKNNISYRTDEQFRLQTYSEHHIGTTPLLLLPVNMIDIFPIDYMHNSLLGICRRMIRIWITGTLQNGKKNKSPYRLISSQKDKIDIRLISLRSCLPYEFSRKTRPLTDIDRWKATELRLFLLYIGKYVMKDILPKKYYNHFLLLSHALSLLVSKKFVNIFSNITIARNLIFQFIDSGRILYGDAFINYNVHSLIHLVDDAERLGSLDDFSAFPFENYLQKIKKSVRGGRSPLVQIINFLNSETLFDESNSKSIKIKYPNNAFLLDKNQFCEILPIKVSDHINYDTHHKCRVFHKIRPYYSINSGSISIISTSIDCFLSKNSDSYIMPVKKSKLLSKGILIRENNSVLFMRILHM